LLLAPPLQLGFLSQVPQRVIARRPGWTVFIGPNGAVGILPFFFDRPIEPVEECAGRDLLDIRDLLLGLLSIQRGQVNLLVPALARWGRFDRLVPALGQWGRNLAVGDRGDLVEAPGKIGTLYHPRPVLKTIQSGAQARRRPAVAVRVLGELLLPSQANRNANTGPLKALLVGPTENWGKRQPTFLIRDKIRGGKIRSLRGIDRKQLLRRIEIRT